MQDESDLTIGDIVEIVGLVSRPELNGTFAVVIEPESPEEKEQLESSKRIKVTSYPNALSLKRSNLRALSRAEVTSLDWSFMDGQFPGSEGKATVLAMLSHPTFFLAEAYKPADFVKHLWAMVARDAPMPPMRHINEGERRAILNNTSKHVIYFLFLDRIGHHIVLEAQAGVARVYQCYVESAIDENGDSFGFTVREWVTGKPDDPTFPLAPDVLVARSCWGGQEPITRAVLVDLLDLLDNLERQSEAVGFAMKAALSGSVRDQSFRAWCEDTLEQISAVAVVLGKADDEPCTISSSIGYAKDAFCITIPGEVARPFVRSFANLLGYPPLAGAFISSLLHVSDVDEIVDTTQSKSAQGWGVTALMIPH